MPGVQCTRSLVRASPDWLDSPIHTICSLGAIFLDAVSWADAVAADAHALVDFLRRAMRLARSRHISCTRRAPKRDACQMMELPHRGPTSLADYPHRSCERPSRAAAAAQL